MWGRAAGQDRCHSLPCGKSHSGSRASRVPELWPSAGFHPLLQAQAVVFGDGGGQGPAVPDSPLLLAGTRIIYDRKFLLECKNSPVARTPPCCLPQIPGVTSLAQSSLVKLEELKERNESEEAMPGEQPRQAAPCLHAAWGMGLPPGCKGKGRSRLSPSSSSFACFSQGSPILTLALYPSIPLQIKTSLRWTSEFPAPRLQAMAGPVSGPRGVAGTVTSWLQPSLMLGMDV